MFYKFSSGAVRAATMVQVLVTTVTVLVLLLPGTTKGIPPVISQQKMVNVSGDFVLGALFPIHRRGAGIDTCGDIQQEDGIQALEALLYTINKINANDTLLPGIRLGVLAVDTCDSNTYAMEQSMIFMKSLISHYNDYHEQEFQCADGSPAKLRYGNMERIVGVIGGQSSSVTIQVNTTYIFYVAQDVEMEVL